MRNVGQTVRRITMLGVKGVKQLVDSLIKSRIYFKLTACHILQLMIQIDYLKYGEIKYLN